MSELVPAAIAENLEAGRRASNLAFALRILPAPRRRDAEIFYRFCRTLDDIADSPQLSLEEKTAALEAWRQALRSPARLPSDFAEMIARREIAPDLLEEILAGVRADLTVRRYETFADARQYCWRVASAVGLSSIRIFGCADPASAAYAESLGLALQWTNILRDVGEDAVNGRIYLPLEELKTFNVPESDLLDRRSSPEFLSLMEFEATRAKQFYAEAVNALPKRDRKALLPAEIMRSIYRRLLSHMEADGFQIFARRYRVSRLEKSWLAIRVLLGLPGSGR